MKLNKLINYILFFIIIILFTILRVNANGIIIFNGFVSDNAKILNVNSINYINQVIYELKEKTSSEIAVVTLDTLNNRPIEEVSLNIARNNKIGKKGKDNGALILIVPKDRLMRIEIGYGLEGIINDAKAGRIRDEYMIPYLKKADYNTGIVNGTIILAKEIAKGYNTELDIDYNIVKVNASENKEDDLLLFLILLLLFTGPLGPLFLPINRYNTSSRGFGSSSIGFGGFGGSGGFGGGGATGRW